MADCHEHNILVCLLQRTAACDLQTVRLREMAVQSLAGLRCFTTAAGGLYVTTRSSIVEGAPRTSVPELRTWHAGNWDTNEGPRFRNWHVPQPHVGGK